MSQVNIIELINGSRYKTLEVFITGDSNGDLVDEVLSDPVDDNETNVKYVIENLIYSVQGFSAVLEFDYLASDSPKVVMPENQNNTVDYRPHGGLADRSGVDGTGKLLITTKGLTTDGFGSLVISLRKKYS